MLDFCSCQPCYPLSGKKDRKIVSVVLHQEMLRECENLCCLGCLYTHCSGTWKLQFGKPIKWNYPIRFLGKLNHVWPQHFVLELGTVPNYSMQSDTEGACQSAEEETPHRIPTVLCDFSDTLMDAESLLLHHKCSVWSLKTIQPVTLRLQCNTLSCGS